VETGNEKPDLTLPSIGSLVNLKKILTSMATIGKAWLIWLARLFFFIGRSIGNFLWNICPFRSKISKYKPSDPKLLFDKHQTIDLI
jgi:hypothetical protein